MEKVIILDTSSNAAKPYTQEGWLSRTGNFFKDEGMARYDGCTHRACRDCGEPSSKTLLVCHKCRNKSDIKKYNTMPKEKWDGFSMVYSETEDRYFSSPDEAIEAMEGDSEEGGEIVSLESLRLVICEPNYISEIDPNDHYLDDIPEDGNMPNLVEDAFQILNKIIREHRCDPISWFSGKKALLIESGEEK